MGLPHIAYAPLHEPEQAARDQRAHDAEPGHNAQLTDLHTEIEAEKRTDQREYRKYNRPFFWKRLSVVSIQRRVNAGMVVFMRANSSENLLSELELCERVGDFLWGLAIGRW